MSNPLLTLICCVILGELLDLSESQSPCEPDGCHDDNLSGLWGKANWTLSVELDQQEALDK